MTTARRVLSRRRRNSAPANTRWLVGTELNLVNRIAEPFKAQGKQLQFMAPLVCVCSTMARIDPQHLAWTLENPAQGRVVNQIKVAQRDAELARVALARMLAVSRRRGNDRHCVDHS